MAPTETAKEIKARIQSRIKDLGNDPVWLNLLDVELSLVIDRLVERRDVLVALNELQDTVYAATSKK